MAQYSKGFMIQYLRKRKGMTQEELAEGICEPVTLSRYENGSLNPTAEKFQLLMERLGGPGDIYLFPVQTERLDMEKKRKEIFSAMERGEFSEVRRMLCDIRQEETLQLDYKENQQYLGRIELGIDYRQGHIDWKNYIRELEKLLRLTFPEFDSKKEIPGHIYTETEFWIACNIGTAYGEHEEYAEAVMIMEALEKYYTDFGKIGDYKPRYAMLVIYSSFLGRMGRYDDSIQVCIKGIKWLKEKKQYNYLYNFYFNIGWNLIEKHKKEPKCTKDIETGRRYIWTAYELCKMYPENKANLEIMKTYYKNIEGVA